MVPPPWQRALHAAGKRLDNRNMRRRPASPKRLPAYALYGETHRGSLAAPDHLHCESIAERSRLHGWEIRPHHHDALFQLLLIEHGAAQVLLEGRQHLLQGPAVVTVPALAAHGFRFAPAVQGLVFTIAEQHLAALLQPHGGLREAVMCARAAPLPPTDASLQAAAATLRDEALGSAPWRAAALDAGLLRLAVALARLAAPDLRVVVPLLPPRAQVHVQRLRALVEAQYRQQPTVAALAAQLGITPTQLNRACRQVLGHPALAVLHGRLLQQAQRELAYTNLSVKQIGIELGFSDAAYFTRFFRRHGGHTPSGWRAACVRL
jgi:AraC family transcriptional regulator, transcriptional activator of pobA